MTDLTASEAQRLLLICGLLTVIIYVFSMMFTALAAWVIVVIYIGLLLVSSYRRKNK